MNRLVRYFPDTDMRLGYDGLANIARKQSLDLENLPKGHFVAFVNTQLNKIKLCTQNDVVAYLRLKKGRIDPRVIARLPEYFNGGAIEYDRAVRATLLETFPKWFEKEKSAAKQLKERNVTP